MDCTHIFRRRIPEEVEQLWGVAETKYRARKSYERQSPRATFTQIGERKQMYTQREREMQVQF